MGRRSPSTRARVPSSLQAKLTGLSFSPLALMRAWPFSSARTSMARLMRSRVPGDPDPVAYTSLGRADRRRERVIRWRHGVNTGCASRRCSISKAKPSQAKPSQAELHQRCRLVGDRHPQQVLRSAVHPHNNSPRRSQNNSALAESIAPPRPGRGASYTPVEVRPIQLKPPE